MRNEEGVWCDITVKNQRCDKAAINVHSCRVEGTEFAFCKDHDREWKLKTDKKQDQMIRCPRCLPGFLLTQSHPEIDPNGLPAPITGPLAIAFDEAMFREGILQPTRIKALQRLAQVAAEDLYLQSIFRSTAKAQAQQEAS
jgi:hypothetical protein